MEKESSVTKITLHYEDGSTRDIDKGFLADIKPDEDDSCEVCFNLVDISGKEIDLIIKSVFELAIKLGILDDE